MNKLLSEQTIKKIEMLGNNGKSLILTRDPESQNCTKHIDIIHHHIQRLVEDGELEIKWISSS